MRRAGYSHPPSVRRLEGPFSAAPRQAELGVNVAETSDVCLVSGNVVNKFKPAEGRCFTSAEVPASIKKRIIRPDGELRYVRWVGVPVVEGEVLKGFIGTAIDITELVMLVICG
jgi:PAS domain-containing protein